MKKQKMLGIILLCISSISLALEMLMVDLYRCVENLDYFSTVFSREALLSYTVPVIWIIIGLYYILRKGDEKI